MANWPVGRFDRHRVVFGSIAVQLHELIKSNTVIGTFRRFALEVQPDSPFRSPNLAGYLLYHHQHEVLELLEQAEFGFVLQVDPKVI